MIFFSSLSERFSLRASTRKLFRLRRMVERINRIEQQLQTLDDAALQAYTPQLRQRIADGAAIDDILCEAFAVVKNACRRLCGSTITVCDQELVWDMIPFDVQLLAGIVLHRRGIAEMATGEGKTLAAAMPLYLNALTGRGCHLVTVNDYLARRDSEWIGSIFRYLGLSVGCLQSEQSPHVRRAAYQCDITYGTNSEFGFDYLRDNGIAHSRAEQVQRGHFFAIIDEIDSVLIDEARTPLIIAGERHEPENQFDALKPLVRELLQEQQRKLTVLLRDASNLCRGNRGQRREGLQKLFQARLGAPEHPQLAKILEDSELRREVDDFETEMRNAMMAAQLQQLKQELFYSVDEKQRQVELTDAGHALLDRRRPNLFVLPDYDAEHKRIAEDPTLTPEARQEALAAFRQRYAVQIEAIHHLSVLTQAYCLYQRDVHYVIAEGKILLVDEHTGRTLPGRRFTNGLHQALEAKENVQIESENLTYASITQQNYFRLYEKLAGMTGTAATEAGEFFAVYKLEVTEIPTNRPVHRDIAPDRVFRTRREKFTAIIDEVAASQEAGQPVLLGTPSVEDSETLSRLLKQRRIPHQVLNAKQNQHEAEIIARAGLAGTVTVATNMAGRGTDIRLGDGVTEFGGLYVIGSSRHDARRIDLQLRGRCSRQGDPGKARFFVSLEDEFMRLFGPDAIVGIFSRSEQESGDGLAHEQLDRMIKQAQRKLELQHSAIRKHTLDYDDVMNKHRNVIYEFRNRLMDGDGEAVLREFLRRAISAYVEKAADPRVRDDYTDHSYDWDGLRRDLLFEGGIAITPEELGYEAHRFPRSLDALSEAIAEVALRRFLEPMAEVPPERRERLLRELLLDTIDHAWVDHLNGMEQLRDGIWFQSYAQKDPLQVYKKEAWEMFAELIVEIARNVWKQIQSPAFAAYLTAPERVHAPGAERKRTVKKKGA